MLRVPEIRFGLSERASAGSSGGPLVYWLFRHLLGLAVLRCRAEAANEVEILVLCHELAVLGWQGSASGIAAQHRVVKLAAGRDRARAAAPPRSGPIERIARSGTVPVLAVHDRATCAALRGSGGRLGRVDDLRAAHGPRQ